MTEQEYNERRDKYTLLCRQISSLCEGEKDLIANMANTVSAIHLTMGFFWTGFYIVRGNELVLGPFQGPSACTRIPYGKGVCGTCMKEERTIIVPDVEEFPGHIACSSLSKSEIVVPLYCKSQLIGVLDIDSTEKDTFNEVDAYWLEHICMILGDSSEL